ncbi:MAG: hypothetical protein NUV50_07120 [Rhodospirillales bacterium]|nr:hypothetical protein [Rhodospirillales bacterium]
MENRERELFETALRDLGLKRLRLDQVVEVYHKTFPTHALCADMRQRLHDAIVELTQGDAVSVPEGDDLTHEDRLSLPQTLEIANPSRSPYFQ